MDNLRDFCALLPQNFCALLPQVFCDLLPQDFWEEIWLINGSRPVTKPEPVGYQFPSSQDTLVKVAPTDL